ncbi:MAG: iron-sulfur cluster assembly scaffold protein [Croceibacterium sp.]
MAAAERLYTPELLGLAVELAQWPPLQEAQAHGETRSAACGSTLAIDLTLDGEGRIANLGLRVRACAIGQAAAAIFARHAEGQDRAGIALTLNELEAWLAQRGPLPPWPEISLIAAARDYPGRHGALLLPWKGALAALSSAFAAG